MGDIVVINIECGQGYRRDCVNKGSCFLRHIGEVPGQKIKRGEPPCKRHVETKDYRLRSRNISSLDLDMTPEKVEENDETVAGVRPIEKTPVNQRNGTPHVIGTRRKKTPPSKDKQSPNKENLVNIKPIRLDLGQKRERKNIDTDRRRSKTMDQLDPVYSTDKTVTGLKNPLNSCYLNAVVQGISSLTLFTEKLMKQTEEGNIHHDTIAAEMGYLFSILK